jgi:hypothetical protein
VSSMSLHLTAERLADAETGGAEQDPEWIPMRASAADQQRCELCGGQRTHLALARAWKRHQICGQGTGQPPVTRLLQRAMEDGVALDHGPRRQPASEQVGIGALDQVRIEPGQWHGAKSPFDPVQAELVCVVGPRPDATARDRQPFLYVGSKLQSFGADRHAALKPPPLLAQPHYDVGAAMCVDVFASSICQSQLALPASVSAQLDRP